MRVQLQKRVAYNHTMERKFFCVFGLRLRLKTQIFEFLRLSLRLSFKRLNLFENCSEKYQKYFDENKIDALLECA